MISLFARGIKGLADTAFSGVIGSAFRLVGIDFRSEPGKIKVHQKLTKNSASVVDALCKSAVKTAAGIKVWFGAASAFVDNAGTYTKKLTMAKITRDLFYTTPQSYALGTASSVIRMNATGTRVYVFARNNSFTLKQYDLTTPYDFSTITREYSGGLPSGTQSFFITDTRLFAVLASSVVVYRITGGDINDLIQVDTWSISAQVTDAIDIAFKDDGTAMYILDDDGNVYTYTIASAWGAYPVFRYLLCGGGAGGGGCSGTGGSFDYEIKGGTGGGGGVDEDANAWLAPGVSHTITPGAAGTGGNNTPSSGTAGGDTIAFDITVKGGGYGSRSVPNGVEGYDASYNGGDGGNGGGGGWTDNNSDSQGYGRSGNVIGSTHTQVGEYGSSTGPSAGASDHVSDISGAEVTYSPSQPNNPTDNTDGAAGASYGQAGAGGRTYDSGTFRSGGNGYAGVAIVRFKTADVSYSHTNGTVTTVGSDTVITWTVAGTFQWTLSSQITYSSVKALEVARAFAVESGRIALIVGDTIKQYTMTAYTISGAVLNQNVLIVDTDGETVTPSSVQLGSTYALVGFETLEETDLKSITRLEYVDSGTTILSAQMFTPTRLRVATTPYLFDSFGQTYWKIDTVSKDGMTDEHTFDLGTDLDRPDDGDQFDATYAKATSSGDISIIFRGNIEGAQSGNNIVIHARDQMYPDLGYAPGSDTLRTFSVDTVMMDALIVGDSFSQVNADGAETVYQQVGFTRDTQINAIDLKLREGQRLNGGYTLILEVKDAAGTVVATDTVVIAAGDIGKVETVVRFDFTAYTFIAGKIYTVELHVDSVASANFNLTTDRYLVWPVRKRGVNAFRAQGGARGDVELQMRLLNTTITDAEEEYYAEERVYFATDKMLFYIKASDVTQSSWSGLIHTVGGFITGDTTYHPMEVQNLSLFIGDNKNMAQIDSSGTFIRETEFNVEEGEVIQALKAFDIDLLVGTSRGNHGRVLRWDTDSESWSADDNVYEKGGVTAFLPDDNYVYVFAGEKGVMYFYNGSKCEASQRIPGVLTGKVRVNANSVGFLNLIPVFGLSNISSNTVLQGVYGFGKYAPGYPVALSLDYPLSTGNFTGITVGAILTDGDDLYVAWQDGVTYGVDKLDSTAKYSGAYIETTQLADSNTRHQLKTLSDAMVPYCSLPTGTGITLGLKKIYEGAYVSKTVVKDAKRLLVKLKDPSSKDVANPQLRIGFTVSGNNAPEIEDVLFSLAPVGKK